MKNCAQHNHMIVIALISVQCNILSFIGLLCDITTFVIVRSRKMKTLKNYLVSTFKLARNTKYRNWNSHSTKNLFWCVLFWKYGQNPWKTNLKEPIFDSFLAGSLHLYSRTNSSKTIFSWFSSVAERLVLGTSFSSWFCF